MTSNTDQPDRTDNASPEPDDPYGRYDHEDATEVFVQFKPQEWMESYGEKRAIPAEDSDPVEFTVPEADATDSDGRLLADNTRRSDRLKHHENAPDWVTEWDGPFTVSTSGESRL